MCGIFAVVQQHQTQPTAEQKVLAGLQKLEYRGYDSWGIAVVEGGTVAVEKHVGKISQVKGLDLPPSSVAIGHTRWATHGGVTQENAHPHAASDSSFVLAQNGVVQNFASLKTELIQKGHQFISQTDTEVIVRLIEEKQKTVADMTEAVKAAFLDLEGRNTIIILTNRDEIIAARNGSPLILGQNHQTGEIFLSSDTLSFANQVETITVIENGQLIVIKNGEIKLSEIATGKQVKIIEEKADLNQAAVTKNGYDHFMIKEIQEAPMAIEQVVLQDRARLEQVAEILRGAGHVYTIGSGTAGIAASQTAFYLRELAKLSATSLVGADAVEYFPLFQAGDVLIAPSQSGETADVLEVLELAKKKGVIIISYVNMPGSSMTRLANYSFLAGAGPEMAVMSTKIFESQLVWGYLLAKTVQGKFTEGVESLTHLATAMKKYLADAQTELEIKKWVELLLPATDIFLLAKAQNFQIIREGMVKLIEGTYKHAHAIPAGDLKHYAITLMEPGVPVIVLLSDDQVKADVLTAAHEVKARGASVFGVGPAGESDSFDAYLAVPETGETSAIMNVLPLQLLAYYLTVKLGRDVDHPRNIAKSVTVK